MHDTSDSDQSPARELQIQAAALPEGLEKKCARLLPGTLPLFRFHEVGEDIVDAGQMAFTLGLEPSENLRIKPDTHRYSPSDVAQPHQLRQLFFGQARNISEIDV